MAGLDPAIQWRAKASKISKDWMAASRAAMTMKWGRTNFRLRRLGSSEQGVWGWAG
jgi:hypothetical protein